MLAKIKNIIETFQDITLLPSTELEKDTFPACLAFFYGLKKLKKNVNFLCENLPEKFEFLASKNIQAPTTEHFSCSPSNKENFLISIKESTTKLSQIFYQKTESGVNLYLKTDKGEIKQEDVSFESIAVENCLVCMGVKNFSEIEALAQGEKWTSVINIDNDEINNENYGEVNLIHPQNYSFSEIIFDILETLDQKLLEDAEISNLLLTGITQENPHFHDIGFNSNSKIFQKIGFLMKKSTTWQSAILGEQSLENNKPLRIFQKALNKLMFSYEKNTSWLILQEQDFKESGTSPADLPFSFKKLIFSISPFQNFLCLWKGKSSPNSVCGVFYSTQKEISEKVETYLLGEKKGNGVLFNVKASSAQEVKDAILNLL
jgi:nanoRNase/pAp phosphatase (c-di-AMP/oligoRNAs hydrolase)